MVKHFRLFFFFLILPWFTGKIPGLEILKLKIQIPVGLLISREALGKLFNLKSLNFLSRKGDYNILLV